MEQKDLENLKEHLNQFSEEELKERDVYLKQLADGTLQGPPVGYPSIDKTHLRHFTEEEIKFDIPEKTCYETLYEANKDYPNDIAFRYLGKEITYGEFFKIIEKTKESLLASGIKEGEIVTVCSITTPEVLALFYALNRVGAIPNFVDVRYPSEAIKEYIVESNSTKVFTLDLCLPLFEKISKDVNLEEVVYFNAANTAPKPITLISKLSSKLKKVVPKKGKYTKWNDFYKRKSDIKFEKEYTKDYPAAIVHTGGTTGIPKGVLLSNDDFNSVVYQTTVARTNQRRGWKFLNIMPPFIAYGLGLGLYAPLVLGWETDIIPAFDVKDFTKLILKHRPNGIMGVPNYWDEPMHNKKMKGKDLSFIEDVLVGGDATPPAREDKINEFLESHGSKAKVSKGYSMTEATSLATFSNKEANAKESVGIPLVKTKVTAFKLNIKDGTPVGTQEELPVGELGELGIQSTNEMIGYYNNPEETAAVKQHHVDGDWIHTGDIGYVDKDGLVYVTDRIKRIIPRSGFKVLPGEIEKVVTNIDYVASCAVVGIPDEKDVTAPKVYVVLEPNCNKPQKEIIDDIYATIRSSKLPPYFEPVDVEIIDELPKTLVGKTDYKELENRNTGKSIK